MVSTEKKAKLTERLLQKLIFIEDNKGPDGWTNCPTKQVFYRVYRPVISGVHPDLFVYSPDGAKVKLSEGGAFLVKWCR